MVKNREYDYGFHDDVNPTYSTGKGLTEEIVRNISKVKMSLIGCSSIA